jgi:glycosyltransferase involved in cell wall biosynthesis
MTDTTNLLPELSVFFPCYNEEKNIAQTVNHAIPIIKQISEKWEVIIVNDGSKDNTLTVAQKLIQSDPQHLRLVNHPVNRGYGAAFKSGFYHAKYQWIAFTDADGQFDFKDINNLIKKQQQTQADIVIGFYLGRKVPFYRIWGSQLWQLAVWILFGLKVTDNDCGFKLVNKKVIDAIPDLQAERGPFITSEFLVKAKRLGFKIVETGVNHFNRLHGEATGAKLNVILSGFKDLLRLWYKMNITS